MRKAVFYHAGCSVCTSAEKEFVTALNPAEYKVEVVHLGQQKSKITDAEKAGVKSVPALVVDNKVFHINFGASIKDLK
jgi:hypothetical protein